MCDAFSARLFRPWSNLDSRNYSKQIELPVGRGSDFAVLYPSDRKEETGCYNILMTRGKAIKATSSRVFDLPERSSRIGDNHTTEDSQPCGEQLTSKVDHLSNDNLLRMTDHIRTPFVQDTVDPVFHSIYSCDAFRKFNSPQSTSWDVVMMGARLPTQVGMTYPPWVDIRKMQIFNALHSSYDVRGSLQAETMDNAAVQMLQRQAKEPKKLRSKRFRCERCNVAFSNNGQLKGHIRIHTGKLLNIFIYLEIS
jgi:hypothetical protein